MKNVLISSLKNQSKFSDHFLRENPNQKIPIWLTVDQKYLHSSANISLENKTGSPIVDQISSFYLSNSPKNLAGEKRKKATNIYMSAVGGWGWGVKVRWSIASQPNSNEEARSADIDSLSSLHVSRAPTSLQDDDDSLFNYWLTGRVNN